MSRSQWSKQKNVASVDVIYLQKLDQSLLKVYLFCLSIIIIL